MQHTLGRHLLEDYHIVKKGVECVSDVSVYPFGNVFSLLMQRYHCRSRCTFVRLVAFLVVVILPDHQISQLMLPLSPVRCLLLLLCLSPLALSVAYQKYIRHSTSIYVVISSVTPLI